MGEPPTPSRILMTADGIGGVWSYAVDLSRGLGEAGVEVVLAVVGRPLTAAQHREASSIPTLTVVEQPYKLEWMDEPWADVARTRSWLVALERTYAPDLVHLHGYSYAIAPLRAPVLVVAHSCVLSWWEAVHGAPAPAQWARYRDCVREGLYAADSVVTSTRAMLGELERLYGLASPGSVIPNGIDLSHAVRDHKESFVLSAGRLWDEAKNLEVLARVAPQLAWPIYMAGDAQQAPGTSKSVPAAPHTVQELGTLSRAELAEWLGRAAIYAHPAPYEPIGLAVLEAAAAGCSLVLGDIPSLRELWDGAARFVKADDGDALATALTELIEDAALRSKLADAAALRAERFDLASFRDAYLGHYRAMLQRGGRVRMVPRSGRAPSLRTRVASRHPGRPAQRAQNRRR